MPQMRIAARTPHLGAFHEERPVGPRDDILGRDRLPEARPSGARVELGLRAEQRCPAADASIEPLRAQFVILVRERQHYRPSDESAPRQFPVALRHCEAMPHTRLYSAAPQESYHSTASSALAH